eukprot:CAMPEP_0172325986 /NCGR_PEP_ID=MMETSP1058-20130122/55239_1 /TAXON_ID=83371 /ORGANISM="Detonula confervacea, Strain CCMP 353" /LENGTH=853 /DNA_ID=CAMNT_0013042661 /DNA_START=38 /DNA_END=2599 /DNA_ORIENTATION=+
MTDPTAAPSPTSQQYFTEVFCSELPSPCNLYLSGKRCISRRRRLPPTTTASHQKCGKKASAPIMRFGTERHSLTLLQKNTESSLERGRGRGRGDGYHLSVARLPSSKSASRKDEQGKKAKKASMKKSTGTKNDPNENIDVCLSHSSVFWEDDDENGSEPQPCQGSSMEVFAMMKTPDADTDNAKEQKSSDNNSLTTHGSHSMPEVGKDAGGDITDQKSTVEAVGSSTKNNDGESSASSNYYLMIKSRVLLEQMHQEKKGQSIHDQSSDDALDPGTDKPTITSRMSSTVETISLDFRPMSVHATELHISTGAANSQTSCSAIGIFVASVDDNRLRLYVTTKEALERRMTEHGARETPCFASVSDIAAMSEAQGLAMADESSSEPLVFSTPIMAMDTCVTDEECPASLSPGEQKSDTKLNRLAIACYDGTVRILTYQLKSQKRDRDDNDPPLQFRPLRCTTFTVDGPVVSLHFGVTSSPEIPPSFSPSLFLVAGSLCGFACVFYESSLPSSSESTQSNSTLFFDGPVPVVDGLYDARQEGYEDCVTSVHASCRTENQQMIVVGTQGGRVLIFERVQNTREDPVETAKREKDELISHIGEKEKEISRLQSEKEDWDVMAGVLNAIVSETRSKIEFLANESRTTNTESYELNTREVGEWCEAVGGDWEMCCGRGSGELEKHNEADVALESKDEECLDELTNVARKEEDAEPTHSNTNASIETPIASKEMSSFQTKLIEAQTELAPLDQKIAAHVSKIAELSNVLDDALDDLLRAERTINSPVSSMHIGSMRKMHRYKFLWEYHLPYPIHGIASTHANVGVGQEIFISTRRSFHVFRNYSPGGAAALVEEKILKLLSI